MVGRTSSDALASLRLPQIRRYIGGRFLATAGREMLGVAIGWQIYDRTSSPLALGFVGLSQVIPVIALALPAGHFVDRHNRRTVSVLSNLSLALGSVVLAVIAHLGASPSWIYATLFLHGVAVAFEAPSTGSLMAQIVPPTLFQNANAWRSTSAQLARTGGPALAGFVIAWSGGTTIIYVASAVASALFAAALFSIPKPPTPEPLMGPVREQLRAGLRFVFSTELLLAAITLDLFAVLFGGATALLPMFSRDVLHVGPVGLGWLRAAPSIGAFTMALVTTRLPPWQKVGRVLLLSVAGFGLATIGFGLSRSFSVSMGCLVATGVFDNISVVIRLTLEQLITPDALRGRVAAVHHVFIGLSNEMGEFESGVTAALLGPIGSVLLGGIATLAVVVIVALRYPALRRLGPLSDVRGHDPPVATPLAT